MNKLTVYVPGLLRDKEWYKKHKSESNCTHLACLSGLASSTSDRLHDQDINPANEEAN